jgi:hypothetical protein
MDYLVIRDNKVLRMALVASLVLHAAILCIKLAAPSGKPQDGERRASSRLDVNLAKQPKTETDIQPPPRQAKSRSKPGLRQLVMPRRSANPEDTRAWTTKERDDMDEFLNEIAQEAKPPSGKELALRALSMARSMHTPQQVDTEAQEVLQKLEAAKVDRFSIEMYFDAMFRKMNQTAAMTKNETRQKGSHTAAVRFVLNKDGSVKSFKIVNAADQQAEIDYIQKVIRQASPFPAFPPDIRNATNEMVVQICIKSDPFGSLGGSTFTRMSSGQDCR